MPLSIAQKSVADSTKRYRCLVSGRRFGKTHLAIRELCKWASQPGSKVWYVAPTHGMAKQIVWDQIKKRLLDLKWVKKINESDLSIYLINESTIALRSADNPDRLRGVGLHGIVIDEAADIHQKTWTEVLRPTLAETQGSVLFCSTPKGVGNWVYDIFQQSKIDPDNWDSFQYTTIEGGQVPQEELDQARKDLDDRTFAQEFEAKFITYKGIIYYNYGEHTIYTGKVPKLEDISQIFIGMDFNISPFSSVVAYKTDKGYVVFDEIVIYGSNTDEMVEEIKNRYPGKKIVIFPDPASRQRKTSAAGRTDLSILQNAGFNCKLRSAHPRIRDRINAVNSALKSTDNHQKLWITPNCKHLIKSLSRMVYKEGTSIPDDSDNLSHSADALGYMIEYTFPITRNYINNNTPATWTMKIH